MKTELEIREEIRKHKEAIENNFENWTQDEKLHNSIIIALEWVLK